MLHCHLPVLHHLILILGRHPAAAVCPRRLQAYLLQFPLRPPDRPYHGPGEEAGAAGGGRTHLGASVRLKPRVRRMECRVPLDTGCANYQAEGVPEDR